jgi:hypothetical protein
MRNKKCIKCRSNFKVPFFSVGKEVCPTCIKIEEEAKEVALMYKPFLQKQDKLTQEFHHPIEHADRKTRIRRDLVEREETRVRRSVIFEPPVPFVFNVFNAPDNTPSEPEPETKFEGGGGSFGGAGASASWDTPSDPPSESSSSCSDNSNSCDSSSSDSGSSSSSSND